MEPLPHVTTGLNGVFRRAMTSARIYICACGYEKHVHRTTRGDIVCDNCGAEIDETMLRETSEGSPAPASSSSAASAPPESGVPAHVRSAFEEPPSPENPPTPPLEDAASATFTVPPASPFEEAEPVQPPFAAPRESSSTSLPSDSGIFVPPPTRSAPLPATRPGIACVRCNRPFKGDWDRVEGEEGVICYNCSNLASEGTPERLKEQEATATPFPVRPEKRAIQTEKPGPTLLGIDTQSRYFQGALWLAAIATIGLSIYLVKSGAGAPPPSSSDASTAASEVVVPEVVVPEGFEFIFLIWPVVEAYLAGFVALYLVLRITGQLPHGKVGRDVLFLGLLIAGATAVQTMFWFPISVLVSGFGMNYFLRLGLGDIVRTFIVYGLIKFLLSQLWIVAVATWFGVVN